MRQILDFGEVRRGLLGVTIQTIDEESAEVLGTEVDRGALITGIEADSAAEGAGLLVGDIIVGVDGRRIANNRELANAIGLKGSGETVRIEYIREGSAKTATAELGQRTAEQASGADIHDGLAGAQFAISSATTSGGIEVASVEEGSSAAQRGLRSGDIITAVNRQPVQNLQQLQQIAAGNRILFLLVRRGDRQLMLQIR
jgi:S1-C subfamily serine protease